MRKIVISYCLAVIMVLFILGCASKIQRAKVQYGQQPHQFKKNYFQAGNRGDNLEQMVKALEASGGSVKFTVYPQAGHDSWTETYDNPELYKWFLSFSLDNRE